MHAVSEGVGRGRLGASLGGIWAATLAGVVVALLQPAGSRPTALALVLVLAVVAGMMAQIAVGEQRGFVQRFATSTAGSLALVVVGSLLALVGV